MQKIIPVFFLYTMIAAMLFLCSCGNTQKDISIETLNSYLEKKYNDTFTLIECNDFSEKKGNDTLYTFESSSGISCHIAKEYSGGFLGYRYSYTEDYPVMYLRAHPELIAGLSTRNFEMERIDTDDQYCFDSKYVLYFNNYEEIEKALETIDTFLETATAIPDSPYSIPEGEITQKRPVITINTKECSTSFGVSYHYPSEQHPEAKQKDEFLKHAQNSYIQLVREKKLSETLPADLLQKHPAPAIRDIRFQNETVIDCMVYRRQINEYCIDQSCTEYGDCKFYPEKLDALLKKLGWNTKISKRSVTWDKDSDEITLCLKGYGINNTQLHCFKNGKEYSVRGRLLWQNGTNPIVTLSESDLKYLFGMNFTFDQVNLTGELL